MPYNFDADGFYIKEPRSRLSSSELQFKMENSRCVFKPSFGGLGATPDVCLRLIGKRVVDFLLVIIERFARCYI